MSIPYIPDSHADLIDGPYDAALTTIMPDGYPHTTPVWVNRQGAHILINTMRGWRKEKNMRGNPRVTLLIIDPANELRHLEIRGRVIEMTEKGALEHLDELTQLYLNRPDACFFGDCVAAEKRDEFTPIRIRIAPVRVRVEG